MLIHALITFFLLGNSSYFFLSSAEVQNQLFRKIRSGIPVECQTDQARPFVGPDLVQNICKDYQQMPLVGKEFNRINNVHGTF